MELFSVLSIKRPSIALNHTWRVWRDRFLPMKSSFSVIQFSGRHQVPPPSLKLKSATGSQRHCLFRPSFQNLTPISLEFSQNLMPNAVKTEYFQVSARASIHLLNTTTWTIHLAKQSVNEVIHFLKQSFCNE